MLSTHIKALCLRLALKLGRSICGGFSRLILVLTLSTLLTGSYPALGQVVVRTPDPDEAWDVYSLVEVPGGQWIAQSGEACYIESGQKKWSFGGDIYVNSLSYLNGKIWLATRHGAYRVDGNKPMLMSDPDQVVRNVQLVGQEIWLATDKGAYPLSTLRRTPDQELDVRRIEEIDGQIWLATKTGAFRTDRTKLFPIGSDLNLNVHAIKSINGKTWLATETGLYTYDGTTVTPASDKRLYISNMSSLDGQIWLATVKGPYLLEANGLRPLLNQEFDVKEIRKIGGKIWLAVGDHPSQRVPGGVYRLDEDVTISVKPTRSWLETFLQSVLGKNVWVEGVIKADVQYISRANNNDPYNDTVNRQFDVIITFSNTDFAKAVRTEQYSPAGSFERYLPSGRTTIYMSARDKWGNKFNSGPISAWVIPKPFVFLPVLLGLVWWVLLAVALYLAPYSRFCHRALMNPFLRKYLSFGFVPLVITLFPVARRHLLNRYLREISREKEFAEWQTKFVLPDEDLSASHIAELLHDNSVLFLLGESGIGKTSYFKYLVGYYASNKNYLPHVVPVFLPLRRHQGKSPKEIFTGQLAKYGDLTDVELTEWFLSHGDFLIFIDGLNEVDEGSVKAIVSFVDQLQKVNYFYLSSQESYLDFERAEKVALPTLDPERIKQILNLRLGDKAEATIKQFDTDVFKEYGVPQELELAIDLVKEGKPLPRTKLELYEATLKPIFDSWRKESLNYENELCRRAYEMLSKVESSFESKDRSLPMEIRNRLMEDKLLIKRGGQYQFRHDLIRAYLAAKYFAPRWHELFEDKEPVRLDANWNSTIKFVALVYDNTSDTKKLLFAVLKKNSQVAKDVFNWLEKEHPRLVEDWSDEFDLKYGKAMRIVGSFTMPRTPAPRSS